MSLEHIANESLLLEFTNPPSGTPPSIPPDAVYLGDQPLSTSPLTAVSATISPTCEAGGGAIATTSVVMIWTAITGCAFSSATHTFISGGGTVVASATKCRADGQFVLRAGDVGTCAGSWTPPAGPPAVVCACKVELIDAGQTKAKAQ